MVQRRLIDGVTVVNGGIVVVQWRSEGSSMLVQRCAGWLGDFKKKNQNYKNFKQNKKIKKNIFFFFFFVKSKNIFGMPKQMEPKLHYANNLTSIILQNRF
jgi:hypothetical protein